MRVEFARQALFSRAAVLLDQLLVQQDESVQAGQVNWAQSPWSDRLTLGLTPYLFLVEVTSRMVKLDLKPVTFAGTLRYKEVVPSHELPVILVILLIGAVGCIVWQSLHWAWMFWGALLMMLGSAVPPTTKAGPSVGSGVEVILGLSLVATQALILR